MEAEAAFDDLEFEEASGLFRQALASPGSLDERIRAYRGLGLCLAYLGDAAGAQRMFETLLVLDPAAKVNTSLGPKIARPFEAARKAVKKSKASLAVVRDERSGQVSATLSGLLPAADVVELRVEARSEVGRDQSLRDQAHASAPVRIEVEPWKDVQAFARVLDGGGGELLREGSEEAPLKLPATARPPVSLVPEGNPEVAGSRADDARAWMDNPDAVEPSRPVRWPLWVGGAAIVIGGGVAAAMALRAPEPLTLPPANRSSRLP